MRQLLRNWRSFDWRWTAPLIASTFIVYFGALVADPLIAMGLCNGHRFDYHGEWYANWDGQWYKYIVTNGYHFDQDRFAAIVFFPLYPLLGKLVSFTGLSAELSLLCVTLTSVTGLAWLWSRYCRLRLGDNAAAHFALALMLFWPTAFFLRMDYTESLFMLLVSAMLYDCAAKGPLWRVALWAALASLTRPTGILCSAVVFLHAWQRGSDRKFFNRLNWACEYTLLSVGGLVLFMYYQWYEFGNPLLFITKQMAWNDNIDLPLSAYFFRIILEPVWGFFTSGAWHYAAAWPGYLYNWPMWLLLTIAIAFGAKKRWLTVEEVALGVLFLGLAYFVYLSPARTTISIGRYAMAVLPAYLVMGRLLAARGPLAGMYVITALAALLFLNSGLFARWHCMY